MAKHEEVSEAVPGLAEFSKQWAAYSQTLGGLNKFINGLRAAIVQAGNDLEAKRLELKAANANLEKIKKECEIRLAGVNSSQQNVINEITKERIELAAEKRKLEFMASELNRRAVGV